MIEIDGRHTYDAKISFAAIPISLAAMLLHECKAYDISTTTAEIVLVPQWYQFARSGLESKENTPATMIYHFSFSGGSDTV